MKDLLTFGHSYSHSRPDHREEKESSSHEEEKENGEEKRTEEGGGIGKQACIFIFKPGFCHCLNFKGEILQLLSSTLIPKQFSSMPIQVMI